MADQVISHTERNSKACTRCGVTKLFCEFYVDKRNSRPTARCKSCLNKQTRAYAKANKDRALKWQRTYQQKNAARIAERTRSYQKHNAERVRGWSRINMRKRKLRDIGITEDQAHQALLVQDGLCAICQTIEVPLFSGIHGGHLDHCHASMQFRGILCTLCNTAIGKLEDNPDRMLRAAAYVRGELYPWFKGGK